MAIRDEIISSGASNIDWNNQPMLDAVEELILNTGYLDVVPNSVLGYWVAFLYALDLEANDPITNSDWFALQKELSLRNEWREELGELFYGSGFILDYTDVIHEGIAGFHAGLVTQGDGNFTEQDIEEDIGNKIILKQVVADYIQVLQLDILNNPLHNGELSFWAGVARVAGLTATIDILENRTDVTPRLEVIDGDLDLLINDEDKAKVGFWGDLSDFGNITPQERNLVLDYMAELQPYLQQLLGSGIDVDSESGTLVYWAVVASKVGNYDLDQVIETIENMVQLLDEVASIYGLSVPELQDVLANFDPMNPQPNDSAIGFLSFWAQSAVFGGDQSTITIDQIEILLQHFDMLKDPIATLIGVPVDAILNERGLRFSSRTTSGDCGLLVGDRSQKISTDFDPSGNLTTDYIITEVVDTINNMIQILDEVAAIFDKTLAEAQEILRNFDPMDPNTEDPLIGFLSYWAQAAVFGGELSTIPIGDVEVLLQHFDQLLEPVANLIDVSVEAILNEEDFGYEQGELQGVVAYWAVIALRNLTDFDGTGTLTTDYIVSEVIDTINNMFQLLDEVATIYGMTVAELQEILRTFDPNSPQPRRFGDWFLEFLGTVRSIWWRYVNYFD